MAAEAAEVRVYRRAGDLPASLERAAVKKLVEAVKTDKHVKLPLVAENGRGRAELGFRELARLVAKHWREVAKASGVTVLRKPILLVEWWPAEHTFQVRAILACKFRVDVDVTDLGGEAMILVTYGEWL